MQLYIPALCHLGTVYITYMHAYGTSPPQQGREMYMHTQGQWKWSGWLGFSMAIFRRAIDIHYC